MILGFTGTQKGSTPMQSRTFLSIIKQVNIDEFHHGDCLGCDDEMDDLILQQGTFRVTHPPINEIKRAFCHKKVHSTLTTACRVLPAKDYIPRNHDIVNVSDWMIAMPHEYQEQRRSGTWATIRYAKKIKKPLTIIFPDGSRIISFHGQ